MSRTPDYGRVLLMYCSQPLTAANALNNAPRIRRRSSCSSFGLILRIRLWQLPVVYERFLVRPRFIVSQYLAFDSNAVEHRHDKKFRSQSPRAGCIPNLLHGVRDYPKHKHRFPPRCRDTVSKGKLVTWNVPGFPSLPLARLLSS